MGFRVVRTVIRSLVKTPGFTAVAVLTLGLGIGANIAVFAVVDAVLLEPLPFPEPDRLVGVWHSAPGLGWDEINQSPALYFTYRDESQVFEDTGMWAVRQASITGLDRPEQVQAMRVTDGVLPLLRARPLLGRVFSPQDDTAGSPETVILGYDYWQERFGGDRGVLGTTLRVDGRPHEIIGVMRPDLRFLDYRPAVWLPFQFDRAKVFFGNFSYQGIARLRPGATIAQANDEMARMIPHAWEKFPMPPGFDPAMIRSVGFAPLARPLAVDVVGSVGEVLWVLLGTVGIVLLVACANVANLFLVRAEGRRQEFAVRAALGASRGRLARALLGESLTLGLAGGLVGVGLAAAAIRLLHTLRPDGLPRLEEIGIDGSVLAFALAVSVFAGLLFGAIPLLRLRAGHLVTTLKEGGRGGDAGRERHRLRNGLVVAQVGAALVLLAGAGLMVRSFEAMRSVHPGFSDPDQVLTLRLSIPTAEIGEVREALDLERDLVEAMGSIPGVERAAMTSSVTMDRFNSNDPIFVEEAPIPEGQIPPIRRFKWVCPGYFATIGNPIVAGRDFDWADIYDPQPVAIVTTSLAELYWDDPAQAIGKRIRQNPKDPWRRIVGVVGPVHDDGVDQPPTPVVYWPMAQQDFWEPGFSIRRSMVYVLRSQRVGTGSLLDDVQRVVWDRNRNLPLASVRTLEEVLQRSLARTSFTLVMLLLTAGTAVLLGAIGVYAVISYLVAQRTREIGVRMALGAQTAAIRKMVLRRGLILALTGIGVGLAGAVALTRAMSALLFGVSALDPPTFLAVAAGIGAVALVACWIPAHRATRINPIDALRWE